MEIKTIGNSDAVLVLKENGTIELEIPEQDDDDIVPDYVQRAACIAIMLQSEDQDFERLLNEKWNKLREEET